MSPELAQKFDEMQKEIQSLKDRLNSMSTVSDLNPEQRRTIDIFIGNDASFVKSSYVPTNYGVVVNEGGTSSYQVPNEFDGLSFINGKLYGYYNP